MMKRVLVLGAIAGLMLAGGCATSNIVAGSSSLYGIGAQTLPDGTVKANIGASVADFVTTPLEDSSTHAPILVPTMCGGKDAISTYGSITGSASAGVQSVKAPAVSLSTGRGLGTGETARLLALADYQQAAGANVNAMSEYHNCRLTTPPTAAGDVIH